MARILIVDDEEADRLLAKAILERAGHETYTAEGGEEALKQFLAGGIDVVLTDLQMPDVHGFELIAILQEFDPRPAVVAVSSSGAFKLHMAESLGARVTIRKPLDPVTLLDSVDRVLTDSSGPDETLKSG